MASKRNYIDNDKLDKELIQYVNQCNLAKSQGIVAHSDNWPRINDYLADSINKLVTHMSYNGSFISYTYKEEMIGNAIINVLKYLHTYDYTRVGKEGQPRRAFAWLSMIVWRSFLQTIDEEKTQTYIKFKLIDEGSYLDEYSTQDTDSGNYNNTYIDFLRDNKTDI